MAARSDVANASLICNLSTDQQRREHFTRKSLTAHVCPGDRPARQSAHANPALASTTLDQKRQGDTFLERRDLVCSLERGTRSANPTSDRRCDRSRLQTGGIQYPLSGPYLPQHPGRGQSGRQGGRERQHPDAPDAPRTQNALSPATPEPASEQEEDRKS